MGWLQKRSEAQYVDIKAGELNIPHRKFDQENAQKSLKDAEKILEYIKDKLK